MLFGATNIVKLINRAKLVYSSYGIAFDGKRFVEFGNGFATTVVLFDVDNNRKNN